MKETNSENLSVGIMLDEIAVNGSTPIEPRRAVSLPISVGKKEFLDAMDQFQRNYPGRSLRWDESFDVRVSLGCCKVEQSPKPSESHGSPQNPARPDDAGNETPS